MRCTLNEDVWQSALAENRRLKAALRMVMMLTRSDGYWDRADDLMWLELQRQVGVDIPCVDATQQVLRNGIRHVLGRE